MKFTLLKKSAFFVMVIILLLSAGACIATQSDTKVTGSGEPTSFHTDDRSGPRDLPRIIAFRSASEYAAFATSLKLDETEFNSFLQKNGYNMNGITCKQDVRALLGRLEKLPFPLSATASFKYMDVYIDSGSFHLLYELGERKRCDFSGKIDAVDNASERLEEIKSSASVSEVELTRSSSLNRLYVLEEDDRTAGEIGLVFYADIDDRYVMIRTHGLTRSEALEAIRSFDFTTAEKALMAYELPPVEDQRTLYQRSYDEATPEQRARLEAMPRIGVTKNGNTRQILEIMGKLPENTPRITLEQAKKICEGFDLEGYRGAMTDFELELKQAFNEIAVVPDYEGGSGVNIVIYCLDDELTEQLMISLGMLRYIDSQGNEEILFSVPD